MDELEKRKQLGDARRRSIYASADKMVRTKTTNTATNLIVIGIFIVTLVSIAICVVPSIF